MSVLWGTLAVLLAIVWLVTVSDLVRRHLGRNRTIAMRPSGPWPLSMAARSCMSAAPVRVSW